MHNGRERTTRMKCRRNETREKILRNRAKREFPRFTHTHTRKRLVALRLDGGQIHPSIVFSPSFVECKSDFFVPLQLRLHASPSFRCHAIHSHHSSDFILSVHFAIADNWCSAKMSIGSCHLHHWMNLSVFASIEWRPFGVVCATFAIWLLLFSCKSADKIRCDKAAELSRPIE